MKKAIITICPEDKKCQLDCQTNGVSKLQILDGLAVLQKQLATDLMNEARQHVGDNREAQARWIDLQRQNAALN